MILSRICKEASGSLLAKADQTIDPGRVVIRMESIGEAINQATDPVQKQFGEKMEAFVADWNKEHFKEGEQNTPQQQAELQKAVNEYIEKLAQENKVTVELADDKYALVDKMLTKVGTEVFVWYKADKDGNQVKQELKEQFLECLKAFKIE